MFFRVLEFIIAISVAVAMYIGDMHFTQWQYWVILGCVAVSNIIGYIEGGMK